MGLPRSAQRSPVPSLAGGGVQGAAVFARVACDDPELTTFWAGDTRRPFLQYEHQDQADPAEHEAYHCPANRADAGKRRAAGQHDTAEAAQAIAESRIKAI